MTKTGKLKDSKTFLSGHFDLAVNTISQNDLAQLIAWLKKYPRLTMDAEARRFEQAWSRWLGVKYSVMCNSGASANLLMYAALDSARRSGQRKVVVPASGWPTDIAPAIQFGWKPIMCESDPVTFGLDMDFLEKILKRERPETVVVVHVLGVPTDMTRLQKLQRRYGFNIIEDCCASHGSRHQGELVGTFGLISVFSFYYGHHMSTVEGGILCTNDEQIYHQLLRLKEEGHTILLVSHEVEKTLAHADYVLILDEGTIALSGRKEEVYPHLGGHGIYVPRGVPIEELSWLKP